MKSNADAALTSGASGNDSALDPAIVQRVADALAKLPVRDLSDPGGELDGLRLREAARAAIRAATPPTLTAEAGVWHEPLEEPGK
jgi:hypothetical protein